MSRNRSVVLLALVAALYLCIAAAAVPTYHAVTVSCDRQNLVCANRPSSKGGEIFHTSCRASGFALAYLTNVEEQTAASDVLIAGDIASAYVGAFRQQNTDGSSDWFWMDAPWTSATGSAFTHVTDDGGVLILQQFDPWRAQASLTGNTFGKLYVTAGSPGLQSVGGGDLGDFVVLCEEVQRSPSSFDSTGKTSTTSTTSDLGAVDPGESTSTTTTATSTGEPTAAGPVQYVVVPVNCLIVCNDAPSNNYRSPITQCKQAGYGPGYVTSNAEADLAYDALVAEGILRAYVAAYANTAVTTRSWYWMGEDWDIATGALFIAMWSDESAFIYQEFVDFTSGTDPFTEGPYLHFSRDDKTPSLKPVAGGDQATFHVLCERTVRTPSQFEGFGEVPPTEAPTELVVTTTRAPLLPEEDSFPIWVVGFIVVGVLAIIIVVSLVVFCCFCRKPKSGDEEYEDADDMSRNSSDSRSSGSDSHSPRSEVRSYDSD